MSSAAVQHEVLPAERAKASFDVETLTNVLDGGRKFTLKRHFIEGAHSEAVPFVHEEISREELVTRSLTHFMDTHWKYFEQGYKPKGNDMTFMSNARMLTGGLGLHYGVFSSTLRSQCSAEQHEWWLGRANKLGFIGCYAQTELGHGSNVRGIRTTATYDAKTEEWVMNTPALEATKWWATGLYSSTHAAVYAQMILGEKEMGVHVFLVQLRGADLKPLPGVEMGEIGAKLGDNDAAIGFLRMNHVRIPRRHLMERRQHVDPDGTYVRHTSAASAKGKKEAGSSGTGGSKAHYITMLKTRVALANTAGGSLAKAATIAARYSCVRQQGFSNTTSTGSSHLAEEHAIIDYQVQLYRILKWTASAYAIKLVAAGLLRLRQAVTRGDPSASAALPEVHASAAGLKALTCCMAADGIEDLRRACGGHGYLMSSGIAPLEADFKGPNTTAEGDFVVLLLQTARFLMKSVDAAKRGEQLPGLTACLAPLGAGAAFDASQIPCILAVRDGRPAPAVDVAQMRELPRLVGLFQYRVLVAASKAHAALGAALDAGLTLDAARNANARLLYTTAKSHVRYFMLSKLIEEVEGVEDDSCRAVLRRLCELFALADVLEGEQWLGLIDAHQAALADAAVSQLCAELRPDVVALVDAFDIPDRILNSTLGRSDGRVYQALYDAAVASEMNKQGRPAFFDTLVKYLDFDFLAHGHTQQHAPFAKL